MSTRIALAVIFVLAVIAGAWWFNKNFERKAVRVPVPVSEAVRNNPFLALERTLQRLGRPAARVSTIASTSDLPRDGVLIITDRRDALTDAGTRALLQWVRAGGHLITEDRQIGKRDPLLAALGVESVPGRAKKRSGALRPVQARLPGSNRAYKLQMHALQSLSTEREVLAQADTDAATHMLHFAEGRGRVTVFNDLHFMTNFALRDDDHAEFVWALTHLHANGPVAYFDNAVNLSLWRWLQEHALLVIMSGVVLVLLWLWRIVPRFGRVADAPARDRRSLLEHLAASGRFQWQHGAGAQLAEAARELALRKVQSAHPALVGLSPKELAEDLKQRFRLRAEQVQRIVVGGNVGTPMQFLEAIQIYQRLHRRLAGRNGGKA